MSPPGIADVVKRVSDAAFGRPLVTNVLRGQVVEAIISFALEPEWTWCAADYSSWDFERSDGARLEVKNSSRTQTWAPPAHGRIYPSFDIAQRTGRWEGATFVEDRGRAASVYIFAWHGLGPDEADHRDPDQWDFFVVNSRELPDQRRISLSAIRRLVAPTSFSGLKEAVALAAR